jgi:hypothetical protein
MAISNPLVSVTMEDPEDSYPLLGSMAFLPLIPICIAHADFQTMMYLPSTPQICYVKGGRSMARRSASVVMNEDLTHESNAI